MFTLLSRLSTSELVYRQAPCFLGALTIAELFYKWHSFLLETAGFLGTWLVLDALAGLIAKPFDKSAPLDTERRAEP